MKKHNFPLITTPYALRLMHCVIVVLATFALAAGKSPPEMVKSNWAAEILTGVNALRARRESAPLVFDEKLNALATAYAHALAQRGELSHFSADGSPLEKRLDGAGIVWQTAGENLARQTLRGCQSADVVRGWQLSPKHYANIITPEFRYTGIGYAIDVAREQIYFVQVFVGRDA